jgi:hypothetical protein
MEIAAIAALVIFFGLTVVCQIDGRLTSFFRSHDLFGLIPGWGFFAPNPGRFDFHLLYRDELPVGTVTNWREIPVTGGRRWHDWLWNPERRLKKVLFDAFTSLSQVEKFGADAQLSVPYLLLLSYVSCYPRVYQCQKTQFLLMISLPSEPEREPVELVMSERHER